jgi:hypothetical protein
LEDLGLSGKIILKRVFKQSVGRTWIRLILFRIGNSGVLSKSGGEILCSIIGRKFLD